MSTSTILSSALAPIMARYLELKISLGRHYAAERRIVQSLDIFLVANKSADLTQETFERWCGTLSHLTSGVRRYRMGLIRNLCLYRRRNEPLCYVPDPTLFPPVHQYVRPYIFTEDEVVRLVEVTNTLLTTNMYPLRSRIFRLGVVLLYTAGLRRGELLRLRVGDYDPGERTLLVRNSKFHKSRLLPLSDDAAREMDVYLSARRAYRPDTCTDLAPLFWNGSSTLRSYTGTGFHRVFRKLLRRAAIRKPNGCPPRVHDMRHSFALNALVRWYREGLDVQTMLPRLATYMGHVSIVSTEYYLAFVEPLTNSASERFALHYGALVTGQCRGGE